MANTQNQQQRPDHLIDDGDQCGAGYNLRNRAHEDDGESPSTPIVLKRQRQSETPNKNQQVRSIRTEVEPPPQPTRLADVTTPNTPVTPTSYLLPQRHTRSSSTHPQQSSLQSKPLTHAPIPTPHQNTKLPNPLACSSCKKRFRSNDELQFHTNTKTRAHSRTKIRVKDFSDENHLAICPIRTCCFSTLSPPEITQHLKIHHPRQNHIISTSGAPTIQDIYVIPKNTNPSSDSHQCAICLNLFASKINLKNHQDKTCFGGTPWACSMCGKQCRSRETMTSHMNTHHPLPASLNCTGVFKGAPKQFRNSTRGFSERMGRIPGGVDNSGLVQYTFVPSKAVVTSAGELFDQQKDECLIQLIKRAQSQHGDTAIKLNCATLMTRPGTKQMAVFNTQSHTTHFSSTAAPDEVLGRIHNAIDLIANQVSDLGSGLSMKTIKSATLTLGPRRGLRGAGPSFGSDVKWANKVKIRGALNIQVSGEDIKRDSDISKKCFKLTITHQVFYEEFKSSIYNKHLVECQHKDPTRGVSTFCSTCKLHADSEVDKAATKASTWIPYFERLDWTKIEFPSGQDEYKRFSLNNPNLCLSVYRVVDTKGDVYLEYRSDMGDKVGYKNIHIIFASRINFEEQEIQAHFLSVSNLGKLCGKILQYDSKDKTTDYRYSEGLACDHCARTFSWDKKISFKPQMRKTANEFDSGQRDHRESDAYLEHIRTCSNKRIGTTTFPQKGTYLQFKKYEALHDHPISIYMDLETTHTPLSKLCHECISLYKQSRGSQRYKVLKKCQDSNHVLFPGEHRCQACLQTLLETLEEVKKTNHCTHVDSHLTFKDNDGGLVDYGMCSNCLHHICTNPKISPECTHSKTEIVSGLDPISFSISLIENYGPGDPLSYPKILREHTEIAETQDQDIMKSLWKFLKDSRPLIASKWKGEHYDVKDCILSEEERTQFDSANACYSCFNLFDHPPEHGVFNDIDVFSNEALGPEVFKRRIVKTLDHCHRTNKYRGAACSNCNMTMDKKRPQANVFAHNMTSFDGHYILRSIDHTFKHSSIIGTSGDKFKALTVSETSLDTVPHYKKPANAAEDTTTQTEDDEYGATSVKYNFLDSLAFQKDSLANLTKRLVDSGTHPFHILKKSELMVTSDGQFCQELFDLSRSKQIFCYEAISSVSSLNIQTPPPRQEFDSTLGVGSILNESDYKTFLKCWNTLKKWKFGDGMSLRDYLGYYNQLDVLLLAEVHSSFRKLVKQEYDLSPDHFITLPSFSYSCCLRMLNREGEHVELISDEATHRFVERAKRGGLTQVLGDRLHVAPGGADLFNMLRPGYEDYLKDGGMLSEGGDAPAEPPINIDKMGSESNVCWENINKVHADILKGEKSNCSPLLSSKEMQIVTDGQDWYLLYIDANNLYGSSMMMPMPVGSYRFLEEGDSRLTDIKYYFEMVENCHQDLSEMPDWNDLPANEGFFIEVDVEYPESRHDYMRDLPPAPAPTTIRQDDLSEHYKHLWRCRYGQDGEIPDSEKLIASLVDKKGLVLHHTTASLYARLGCKITVRKVLSFQQAPVMRSWVNKATEGRRRASQAGDTLLVNLYKLMVNSVYGKFIENIEGHFKTKLVQYREDALNDLGNPLLKSFSIIDENNILCSFYKEKQLVDRPTALGVAILETSKAIMYSYYYEILKVYFGQNIKTCYIDTDSFILRVFTKNLDEDLFNIRKTLDTSNYPEDSKLHTREREKQLFYFKNESPNDRIICFVGLRPKSYSIVTESTLKQLIERWTSVYLERNGDSSDRSNLYSHLQGVQIRNKGVAKSVGAELGLIPLLATLMTSCYISCEYGKFQTISGIPHLIKLTKVCLSALDNKVNVYTCGIHSQPWGYYNKNIECRCNLTL